MAGANTLIDSGAMYAVLTEDDAWHSVCAAAWQQLTFPVLASEAVLAEFFHLVGDNSYRKRLAWRFVRSGLITVANIPHSELENIENLMLRYSDLPMDYADATLVHLAERESIQAIFTVDQKDFSVYRIKGRRAFQILPAAQP